EFACRHNFSKLAKSAAQHDSQSRCLPSDPDLNQNDPERIKLLSKVLGAARLLRSAAWSRLVDFAHFEMDELLGTDRMKRLHDRCIGGRKGFPLFLASRWDRT